MCVSDKARPDGKELILRCCQELFPLRQIWQATTLSFRGKLVLSLALTTAFRCSVSRLPLIIFFGDALSVQTINAKP
jgi:hypothetical protein